VQVEHEYRANVIYTVSLMMTAAHKQLNTIP